MMIRNLQVEAEVLQVLVEEAEEVVQVHLLVSFLGRHLVSLF